MNIGLVSITFSAGGVDWTARINKQADGASNVNGEIQPAKAGTLTTRTDGDTGAVTVVGHNLQVGDKFDLYWVAGGVTYKVELNEVTAVNGNIISFDNGTGTALPAQGSEVFACKVTTFDFAINSNPKMIGVFVAQAATVRLMDANNVRMTLNLAREEGYAWTADGFAEAPLASQPVNRISASTPYTAAPVPILAAALIDA